MTAHPGLTHLCLHWTRRLFYGRLPLGAEHRNFGSEAEWPPEPLSCTASAGKRVVTLISVSIPVRVVRNKVSVLVCTCFRLVRQKLCPGCRIQGLT